MLDELVSRATVDLQHAERPPVSLQYDVHRAMNAVSDENLRRSEAFLVIEMIGDDWLASFQRKSGRGSEVRADAGDADNAWIPTDAGPDQKAVFGGNVLEHLTEFSAKALGGQPGRIREELLEPGPLQRANSEFGQDLLLPNALLQRAQG
jgi:hypothetical protein